MPVLIDGRSLQPPEPLERALEALDMLAPGDELVLLVPHRPRPLYSVLDRHGFQWREVLQADGTVEIHITHRPGRG
jgi:uncharacterized protein (DUF2249 family)